MKRSLMFLIVTVCIAVASNALIAQENSQSKFSLGFQYGYAFSGEADFDAPALTIKNGSLEDDFGKSAVFGFSVGYMLSDKFQLELETGIHQDHKCDDEYEAYWDALSLDIKVQGFFEVSTVYSTLNLHYLLPKVAGLTPSVGAGVGVAFNKVHEQIGILTVLNPPTGIPAKTTSVIKDETTSSLAWQAVIGLTKQLTDDFDLAFNYEYQVLGDVSQGTESLDGQKYDASEGVFKNSVVELNFIYNF